MMKILLIDPPWYRFFGQLYTLKPMGLCYLAAHLEKIGFDVKVYNGDLSRNGDFINALDTTKKYGIYTKAENDCKNKIWEEIKSFIEDYGPEIIGITSVTAKINSAVNLARIIKQINNNITVIIGGVHATVMPEETINLEGIDYVVRGEGEYTMAELCKSIKEKSEKSRIKGITYKNQYGYIMHTPSRGIINNIDELSWPTNHLIVNKDMMLPDDFGHIFATRGCPYECIFCASRKIWTRRVRFRSPGNILAEISMIKEKYNPVFYHFEDDSFTINRNFVSEICEGMLEKKIKIRWICETRVDLIENELLKLMKKSGCVEIILGIESGNQNTLDKIKKGITISQIKNAVKICKKNNIETSMFFLIGFPWETESDINDTIKLMEELDPQNAVFSIATPYPGTELFEICKNDGLLPEKIDWSIFFHQSPEMFLNKHIPRDRIMKIINKIEKKVSIRNRKKHIKRLLNPYKLYLELKRSYKRPFEIYSKVRYILK